MDGIVDSPSASMLVLGDATRNTAMKARQRRNTTRIRVARMDDRSALLSRLTTAGSALLLGLLLILLLTGENGILV